MSEKKPDLYSMNNAVLDSYPMETEEQFILDIAKGVKPSVALQSFIKSNACESLDSSVILDLLRKAYTGIKIGEISGLIHDSGYPFAAGEDLSHLKFDEIVTQAYENPSEW